MCGVEDKPFCLVNWGHGFNPGLLQFFRTRLQTTIFHDKLLTRTYCEEAGDCVVPNMFKGSSLQT